MYQRAVQLSLPKAQAIDIEFNDVVYEVSAPKKSKKRILKGVKGSFKSGELTAIMGPSGAGKSSLLNILTGFEKNNWTGTIDYLGNQGKRTWSQYRKESCYIQQDDQLHPLFTVIETMRMATDLKIGHSLNEKAKQMLIDDILDSLDLSKTKETRCNRLSGGQRKRLSIALELVDNPPVMFLDEPTTGLDSLSTIQCVSVLQSLARLGRTIVCTIHQPSAAIYEMFDHVYLLAEGQCIYEGAPQKTVAYLNSVGLRCPKYHNPADYMIEVACGEYGYFNDQLAMVAQASDKSWRSTVSMKNQFFKNEAKATILINPPSEVSRFWVLLNRCVLQLYRDWTMLHLKVVVSLLIGLLLGMLYTDAGHDGSKSISNSGYFLVTAVYLCYTSMLPAALKFPLELPTLRKERFNNWYQLRTYYAASLLSNVPLQIVLALLNCSTSYFLSNQPPDATRFAMFLVVAILTCLVSEGFGLMIGTLTNPVNATFLAAIYTCALVMFAGFLILYSHMPVLLYYISYLSYLKYTVHAFFQSIYGYNREKLPCPSHLTYCHYRLPEKILEDFSMAEDRYWIDVLILFLNFVAIRIVVYCTLKKKLSTV